MYTAAAQWNQVAGDVGKNAEPVAEGHLSWYELGMSHSHVYQWSKHILNTIESHTIPDQFLFYIHIYYKYNL